MRKQSRLGRILSAFGIGKKAIKPRSLHCEPLEQRQLLSVVQWDGGSTVDSKWQTKENWVGDMAPVAGDTLVFAGNVRTGTQNDFAAGTSFASIEFATNGNGFTIAGNALTLTNGAAGIKMDSGTTTETISANIALGDAVSVSVVDASATLTISGVLSGSNSLTKTGGGTLILTGANTYSGVTTISAGTLQIGNATTTGTLGTNSVTDNAALVFKRSNSITVNNNISGSGTLTQAGSGTLYLGGGNTYTGDTRIVAGTLSVSSFALQDSTLDMNVNDAGSLALGTVTNLTVTLGGLSGSRNLSLSSMLNTSLAVGNNGVNTIYSGNFSGTMGLTKVGAGTLILTGANTYTRTTTISDGTLQIGNAGTTGTLGPSGVTDNASLVFNRSDNLAVSNAISGTGALTQQGTGTLILTGTNAYSGVTTISAGTLQIGNNTTTGTLGAGSVTDNAALVFNRSDGLTVSNVVSGTGTLTQQGAGTPTLSGANTYAGNTRIGAGTLTLGNALALQSSTLNMDGGDAGSLSFDGLTTATFGGLIGSRNLSLQNASSAAVAMTVGNNNANTTYSGTLGGTGSLTKNGTGTLTLAGTNTYSGGTTIGGGTLATGSLGALGALDNGVQINNGAVLDLDGYNQAVGTVSLINGSIVNTGGAAALMPSWCVLMNGTISADLATGTILKTSNGTVLLNGNNTYSGLTTVYAGTLELDVAAQSPVLTGAGADVQSGKIVFDYSGSDPASTIQQSLVSGAIHSSTANSSNTPGWMDDTGNQKVTVEYTRRGDANLDGTVDTNDLSVLLANYSRTGMTWSQGDFNGDGTVDTNDLSILLANYSASTVPLAPLVSLISRLGASPTNAGTVQFIIAFSQGVTGVDASDFQLACFGTGGTISSVVGCDSGTYKAVYLVTVTGVSGNGTLGLNLVDNDSILNGANPALPLAGTGTGNGNFTGSQYTLQTGLSYVAPGGLASSELSAAGVRYSNGDVALSTDELGIGGTRSYSAQDAADLGMGYGWQMTPSPYLTQSTNQIIVAFNANEAYWFNVSGGTYTAQFGAKQTLTQDATNHLLVFTDTDGTVYEFNDFSQTAYPAGSFSKSVASNGGSIVASWSGGTLQGLQYFLGGQTTAYQTVTYTYYQYGANAGRLETAVLQHYDISSAQMQNVRQVTYTYYDGVSDPNNGLLGDLRMAVSQVWLGAWTGDDTYYYRYYTDGDRSHCLKMAFDPQEYQNVENPTASGGLGASDPTALTDAQLLPYSSEYYQYNDNRQVISATIAGLYTYSYASRSRRREASASTC